LVQAFSRENIKLNKHQKLFKSFDFRFHVPKSSHTHHQNGLHRSSQQLSVEGAHLQVGQLRSEAVEDEEVKVVEDGPRVQVAPLHRPVALQEVARRQVGGRP